jgi:hypothetical protein
MHSSRSLQALQVAGAVYSGCDWRNKGWVRLTAQTEGCDKHPLPTRPFGCRVETWITLAASCTGPSASPLQGHTAVTALQQDRAGSGL